MAEIRQITTEQKLEWVKGLAKKDCRGPCDYCPPPINILCGKVQPWAAPDYCDMIIAVIADLEYAEQARAQRPKVAEMAVATRDILADDDLMALVGDRAMIGRLAAALAALEADHE